MGLNILYPKPGDPQPDSFVVDIVAVHGLNGDPTNTWKHPRNNHFWLQDSLPIDVKGVRVLSFGYNADVVRGTTTADIWDHAKSLLGSLIDERETDDEIKRPIIFIAHSLGGIIVEQALVWAHRESQYQTIRDHTLGVVFFGTPHRGSNKASYGKILANVATGVMHKPKSKLISALQNNSETLMRLTSDFKFEAPNMEIMTFYETKPMGIFSSLIVEKQSALLELSHEDSQPVDANHRDMCKFETREDEPYRKLVKRLNRMLKGKERSLPAADCSSIKLQNKHFELPFDVSPYFTGGDDLCCELRESCLPSEDASTQTPQKRFVLYGLGGSGKTQMALKFASDHRERFWGIFFIDTSSANVAEQALSKMAQTCKIGESMEDFKRFLTNSLEPWLLILDNADDPSLDISRFFPTGNRGTIIVTSRNPECRCHASVGARKLREMDTNEAITLLLRSGDLPSEDEDLRGLALPIVQTLGYLALAVNHAGASLRQKICSLENYLEIYTYRRKRLLDSRPVQASSDYNYTVYTTWEVSVDSIKKLASEVTNSAATNALEFLTFCGFCHFDNITESMFRSAWENFGYTKEYPWWESNLLGMIQDRRLPSWDYMGFNETIQLLSSYSLIHVSGQDSRISLHPLVHSWIRDSLDEEMHLRWWEITISTLALARGNDLYQFQGGLKSHMRHCIGIRQATDLFLDDEAPLDRVEICSNIICVYFCYPFEDSQLISRPALEYSRRVLGDECYSTYLLSYHFAKCFNSLSEHEKALDLLQDLVDVSVRILGPADQLTLNIMSEVCRAYRSLGRMPEALEIAQKSFAICQELVENGENVNNANLELARVYIELGRNKEAVDFLKKLRAKRKEIYSQENGRVGEIGILFAFAYCRSGEHQAALELFQDVSKNLLEALGEDNLHTLNSMGMAAIEYGHIGQPEKGIPLLKKVLEVGSRTGAIEHPDKWENRLRRLESESARLESQSANTATTISKTPTKPQEVPHSERKETTSRKRWRLT